MLGGIFILFSKKKRQNVWLKNNRRGLYAHFSPILNKINIKI